MVLWGCAVDRAVQLRDGVVRRWRRLGEWLWQLSLTRLVLPPLHCCCPRRSGFLPYQHCRQSRWRGRRGHQAGAKQYPEDRRVAMRVPIRIAKVLSPCACSSLREPLACCGRYTHRQAPGQLLFRQYYSPGPGLTPHRFSRYVPPGNPTAPGRAFFSRPRQTPHDQSGRS